MSKKIFWVTFFTTSILLSLSHPTHAVDDPEKLFLFSMGLDSGERVLENSLPESYGNLSINNASFMNATIVERLCFSGSDVCIVPATNTWIKLIGINDPLTTDANRNLQYYNSFSRNLVELTKGGKFILGYTDTDKYITYNNTADEVQLYGDEGMDWVVLGGGWIFKDRNMSVCDKTGHCVISSFDTDRGGFIDFDWSTAASRDLAIRTKDASNVMTERMVFKNYKDIADIEVNNANLTVQEDVQGGSFTLDGTTITTWGDVNGTLWCDEGSYIYPCAYTEIVEIPDGTLTATVESESVSGTNRVLTIGHDTTGTPLQGFGVSIDMQGETTTMQSQTQSLIESKWYDPTHATRSADLVFRELSDGVLADVMKIRGDQKRVEMNQTCSQLPTIGTNTVLVVCSANNQEVEGGGDTEITIASGKDGIGMINWGKPTDEDYSRIQHSNTGFGTTQFYIANSNRFQITAGEINPYLPIVRSLIAGDFATLTLNGNVEGIKMTITPDDHEDPVGINITVGGGGRDSDTHIYGMRFKIDHWDAEKDDPNEVIGIYSTDDNLGDHEFLTAGTLFSKIDDAYVEGYATDWYDIRLEGHRSYINNPDVYMENLPVDDPLQDYFVCAYAENLTLYYSTKLCNYTTGDEG